MKNNTRLSSDFDPNILHPLYLIRNRLLKALLNYIPEFSGSVLDFGCGVKPYESLFTVERYIGVDFVGEGETYSKEKVDVIYNGKILPFSDESFDGIFSSEVFEHIFNLDEIIRELYRVLKVDGKILITCPFTMPEHEVPNDFARYTSFAIKHKFESNGFKIVSYDRTGNFIEAIFQLHIIYLDQYILKYFRKIPVLRSILRIFVYASFNISAIVTSFLFPKGESLYLNNVILAQKIRK